VPTEAHRTHANTGSPGGRMAGRGLATLLTLLMAAGLMGVGSAIAKGGCPGSGPAPAASASPGAPGSAPVWARAQVLVDAQDLRVCADGQPLLSLRDHSASLLRAEFSGEWPFLSVAYELRALSLLGPFLSVEERRSTENPGTYLRERVRVYDLREPGREVTMDTLFKDPALRQALLANPLVQRAAGRTVLARAAARSGQSSSALAAQLAQAPTTDRQGQPFLPLGWLGGFWFEAPQGGSSVIGLALPQFSGMREETLLRSQLRLPVWSRTSAWPSDRLTPSPVPSGWARWSFTERP
jgi:hypothetical protein